MGAATAVSAGAGALGAVTGGIQYFSEKANQKKIAREIANMKEVPLTNVADGMQVSTLGSDLQKEQQAQLAATQTAALQDGGTRALLGGLGRVSANSQDVNATIAANLDQQQNQIEQIKAEDEANIRATKENRKNAKLAALSSQYNAASQNATQGLSNVVQGLGMAGNALGSTSSSSGDATPKIEKKIKIDPTTGRSIYAV